jgi:hypothetical protein
MSGLAQSRHLGELTQTILFFLVEEKLVHILIWTTLQGILRRLVVDILIRMVSVDLRQCHKVKDIGKRTSTLVGMICPPMLLDNLIHARCQRRQR